MRQYKYFIFYFFLSLFYFISQASEQDKLDVNEEGVRWKTCLPEKMKEVIFKLSHSEFNLKNKLQNYGKGKLVEGNKKDWNPQNLFSAAVLLYEKKDTDLKMPIGPFYFTRDYKDIKISEKNISCISGHTSLSFLLENSLSGFFADSMAPIKEQWDNIPSDNSIFNNNIANFQDEFNREDEFNNYLVVDLNEGAVFDTVVFDKLKKKSFNKKNKMKQNINNIKEKVQQGVIQNIYKDKNTQLKSHDRYNHSEQYFLHHLINNPMKEEFSFTQDVNLNLDIMLNKIRRHDDLQNKVIGRVILLCHSTKDMCGSCAISFAYEYANNKENSLCKIVKNIFSDAQANIVVSSRTEWNEEKPSRRLMGRDKYQNDPINWGDLFKHRLIVQYEINEKWANLIQTTPNTTIVKQSSRCGCECAIF